MQWISTELTILSFTLIKIVNGYDVIHPVNSNQKVSSYSRSTHVNNPEQSHDTTGSNKRIINNVIIQLFLESTDRLGDVNTSNLAEEPLNDGNIHNEKNAKEAIIIEQKPIAFKIKLDQGIVRSVSENDKGLRLTDVEGSINPETHKETQNINLSQRAVEQTQLGVPTLILTDKWDRWLTTSQNQAPGSPTESIQNFAAVEGTNKQNIRIEHTEHFENDNNGDLYSDLTTQILTTTVGKTKSLGDELEETIEEGVIDATNGARIHTANTANVLIPSSQIIAPSHTAVSGKGISLSQSNNFSQSSHIIDFSKTTPLRYESSSKPHMSPSLNTATTDQSIITATILNVGGNEQLEKFVSVADHSYVEQIEGIISISNQTSSSTTFTNTKSPMFNKKSTQIDFVLMSSTEKSLKIATTPPLVIFQSRSGLDRTSSDDSIKKDLLALQSAISSIDKKEDVQTEQIKTALAKMSSRYSPTLDHTVGDREILYKHSKQIQLSQSKLIIGEGMPELSSEESKDIDQDDTLTGQKVEGHIGATSLNGIKVEAATSESDHLSPNESENIATVLFSKKAAGNELDNLDTFKKQITATPTTLFIQSNQVDKKFIVKPNDYFLFPENIDDEYDSEQITKSSATVASNSNPTQSATISGFQMISPNIFDFGAGSLKGNLAFTPNRMASFPEGSTTQTHIMREVDSKLSQENYTKIMEGHFIYSEEDTASIESDHDDILEVFVEQSLCEASETSEGECVVSNNINERIRSDILFLVDVPLDLRNFKKALRFIIDVVREFQNIGPDGIQVSLIQLSHEPILEFSFRKHTCKPCLIIDIADTEYMNGSNILENNIEKAAKYGFNKRRGNRDDAENVLVIVGCYVSTDRLQDSLKALQLNMTVMVFSTENKTSDVIKQLNDGKRDSDGDGYSQNVKVFADELVKHVTNISTDRTLVQDAVEEEDQQNNVVIDLMVQCLVSGFNITFELLRSFGGVVSVRGRGGSEECYKEVQAEQFGDNVETRFVNFFVDFKQCGAKTVEFYDPRGVNYSVVVNVLHDKWLVTGADRGYVLNCFRAQKEDDQELSAELDVHGGIKIARTLPLSSVPPRCTYSVRRGSPNGPLVLAAKLGEVIYHHWECNGNSESSDVYGLHVHDCYVESDTEEQREIIDTRGCSVDTFMLQNLIYADDKLFASAQSQVYAFADSVHLVFHCKLSLCTRKGDGCEGITPPKCANTNHTDLLVLRRTRHYTQSIMAALTSDVDIELQVIYPLSNLPFSSSPAFYIFILLILTALSSLFVYLSLQYSRANSPNNDPRLMTIQALKGSYFSHCDDFSTVEKSSANTKSSVEDEEIIPGGHESNPENMNSNDTEVTSVKLDISQSACAVTQPNSVNHKELEKKTRKIRVILRPD